VVWKEQEGNPDAFPLWERPLDFPDEDWEMSVAQFAAKTDQELADGLDELLTISRIVAWVVDPMRPRDGASPVTMDGVAWTEWEAGTAEEVRELVLARLRSERDAAWRRMKQGLAWESSGPSASLLLPFWSWYVPWLVSWLPVNEHDVFGAFERVILIIIGTASANMAGYRYVA
jgi:hypothetical protein